jgi:N-acetylneuraminate synthase/N,N'-diacetyllegionaminate synthase
MSFLPDKTLIIAEIGSNHDGDLDKALRMIDVAAEVGANVAKFQSFLADEMYAPGDPNHALLKKLEMPREWYPKLYDHCEQNGIRFLSTATNETTLGWMEDLGMDWYKIASGNITHRPLIDRLIEIGKPIIFSTGVASLDEILDLAGYLRKQEHDEFAFLHCVSEYPAPADHIRLGNIEILTRLLQCPVGFSDHSETPYLALAAVALGARIIEKHLTLDGVGVSPDHAFSQKPEQFRTMVNGIREVESGLFIDFSPNSEGMYSLRRSLHYASDLKAGHALSLDDLKIIRPEDGLAPKQLHDVVGQTLMVNVKRHDPVRWHQIEVTR